MHPDLRPTRHAHPVNVAHFEGRSSGERIADAVAARVGSWPFIVIQSTLLMLWIVYNAYVAVRLLNHKGFDPFPFILLNLMLSFQAAYTGPVVMMSQNRRASKDRDMAEHDYAINQRSFEHLMWQNAQIIELLQALKRQPTAPPPPGDMPARDAG